MMGGNSTTAAIGTLAGVPGVPGASVFLPGVIEALAAELQAGRPATPANSKTATPGRSSGDRDRIPGFIDGRAARKTGESKAGYRDAAASELPPREGDIFWPVFGGYDSPAMLATKPGGGPWWAGNAEPEIASSAEFANRAKRASRAYLHAGDAMLRGAADLFSSGLADEAGASADTLTGLGSAKDYAGNLEAQRSRDRYDAENFPMSRLAGQAAAGVALATRPLGLIAALPSIGRRIFTGAATGAAASGAYGFGSGEGGFENRLERAREEARLGAAVGGAFPALSEVGRKGYRTVAGWLPETTLVKAATPFDKFIRMQGSKTHLHDGPEVQTPFEVEYPIVAPHDPNTGRLLTDKEGRNLIANKIAGRVTKDGPDVALSPAEVRAALEASGYVRYREVGGKSIGGRLGRTHTYPAKGEPRRVYVKIDKTLDGSDHEIISTHEFGHAIHSLVGEIPIDGIEDELRYVYNYHQKGNDRGYRVGPEDVGYLDDEVYDELIAEGYRAYLRRPGWFKKVAPNAAERFRSYANANSKISPYIQFNSVAPIAAAGLGTGVVVGEEEDVR